MKLEWLDDPAWERQTQQSVVTWLGTIQVKGTVKYEIEYYELPKTTPLQSALEDLYDYLNSRFVSSF